VCETKVIFSHVVTSLCRIKAKGQSLITKRDDLRTIMSRI